jgi:hypothetical protein
MRKHTRASRREFWEGVVVRQKKSGLSVGRFCRRENLSSSTFYRWNQKLRGAIRVPERSGSAGPAFAPVRVVPETAEVVAGGTIEILLGRDRRVRLSGRVDPTALADVLAVLEGDGSSC